MAEKKFYIVFNSRGDDGKTHGGHVVSSLIEGTQDMLENTFDPPGPSIGEPIPVTRYLLREVSGGADGSPNSKAWANYDLDPNDEATPYATFEEAQTALEAL